MKPIIAPEKIIFICNGDKCGKYSKAIRKYLRELVKENNLKNNVEIVKMDCTDNCKHAPVLCIQPINKWFGEISEKKVEIFFEDFIK